MLLPFVGVFVYLIVKKDDGRARRRADAATSVRLGAGGRDRVRDAAERVLDARPERRDENPAGERDGDDA